MTKDSYYYIHVWSNQGGGPSHLSLALEVPDEVRNPPRENTKPEVT